MKKSFMQALTFQAVFAMVMVSKSQLWLFWRLIPVIFLYSNSPSRKQAIKAYLGILHPSMPLIEFDLGWSTSDLLTAGSSLENIFILDQDQQNPLPSGFVEKIRQDFPDSFVLCLGIEAEKEETSSFYGRYHVLSDGFDPNQFLEIIQSFLKQTSNR